MDETIDDGSVATHNHNDLSNHSTIAVQREMNDRGTSVNGTDSLIDNSNGQLFLPGLGLGTDSPRGLIAVNPASTVSDGLPDQDKEMTRTAGDVSVGHGANHSDEDMVSEDDGEISDDKAGIPSLTVKKNADQEHITPQDNAAGHESDHSPLQSEAGEASSDHCSDSESDSDSDPDENIPEASHEEVLARFYTLPEEEENDSRPKLAAGQIEEVTGEIGIHGEIRYGGNIPEIQLDPNEPLSKLGTVISITDLTEHVNGRRRTPTVRVIVIKDDSGIHKNLRSVLDVETPVCLSKGLVVGEIADTIGKVTEPAYVVAFKDQEVLDKFEIAIGTEIYYPANQGYSVEIQALIARRKHEDKPTDGENMFGNGGREETPEFSDDEQEEEYKRQKKQKKLGKRKNGDGEGLAPSRGGFKSRKREYVDPDRDDGVYSNLSRPGNGVDDGYQRSSRPGADEGDGYRKLSRPGTNDDGYNRLQRPDSTHTPALQHSYQPSSQSYQQPPMPSYNPISNGFPGHATQPGIPPAFPSPVPPAQSQQAFHFQPPPPPSAGPAAYSAWATQLMQERPDIFENMQKLNMIQVPPPQAGSSAAGLNPSFTGSYQGYGGGSLHQGNDYGSQHGGRGNGYTTGPFNSSSNGQGSGAGNRGRGRGYHRGSYQNGR